MIVRVGHLYPEYLNIYADRGNIAVFERRAAARGHELRVDALTRRRPSRSGGVRPPVRRRRPGSGAGDDRTRPRGPRRIHPGGDRPGRGAARRVRRIPAPRSRVPGPGRILAPRRCALPARDGGRRDPHDRRRPAREHARRGARADDRGFENHAGRTLLDDGAPTLGRVVAGYGNDGTSGHEGCRVGNAVGTYLHGPLLPRNPWLADLILSWALAHATGDDAEPLDAAPGRDRARGARGRSRQGAVTRRTAGLGARSRWRGKPRLLGPAGAEVHARVAGLPARGGSARSAGAASRRRARRA